MKIALVGYGKMGHMLRAAAEACGHEVVVTIDVIAADADVKVPAGDGKAVADAVKASGAEGVIEFTHPTAVMENIKNLLPLGLPIVVGTTGWNDKYAEVEAMAKETNGIILGGGNFSVGVNLLYKIIAEAQKLIAEYPEYDTAVWEMHHTQKADSPSGTALEIAKVILDNCSAKTEIVTDEFKQKPEKHQLHVSSTRCGNVPGTHSVFFDGPADTIEIKHTARSREGFAYGAVHGLEKLDAGLKDGSIQKGRFYKMTEMF